MAMAVDLSPPISQTSPPTKRRRKTGTAGAANDCFACQKKGTVCDRVRPYCGPCLQLGSNCSGYKTVLTWGVGVASRGKLRGKTLPIQKSASVAADLPRSTPRAQFRSSAQQTPRDEQNANKRLAQQPAAALEIPNKRPRTSNALAIGNNSHSFAYSVAKDNVPQKFGFHNHLSEHFARDARHSPPVFSQQDVSFEHGQPLHRLYTSLAYPSDDSSLSSSTGSTWSSVSASGYPGSYIHEAQPIYSPRAEVNQFIDPYLESDGFMTFKAPGQRPILNSYESRTDSTSQGSRTPSSFSYDGQEGILHMPSTRIEPSSPIRESPMSEDTALSFVLSPGQSSWDPDFDADFMDSVEAQSSTSTAVVSYLPRSSLDMPFFHLPKRMQYLMDHYAKSICPFLVAFDGPNNPYRMHIMHMAMQNEGLQNAIAALVTNNIRMRRIEDVTHVKMEGDTILDIMSAPGCATPEEEHYKSKSIEHLNLQLTSNNKQKASEDTVLATLLILCLFHVCNSGFSKFSTQLAGVQKLLRMRSRGSRSSFIGWIEMFFAWLDVMTSAVNDRETEIRGDALDMSFLTANVGALEQFSGCDGRLFKLIARLGRLNLLSQNRPVRPELAAVTKTGREVSPMSKNGCDFYSLNFDDGLENYSEPAGQPGERHTEMLNASAESRSKFWAEWKDLRSKLWAWRMDPAVDSIEEPLPMAHANMVGISESFRYSALLYIERLANPEIPSNSHNLQALVEKALAHIEEIGTGSCVTKFMLWPLFITGTESVHEKHRNLIRERCVEIQQESGFYNNLSGLKVLERVWRNADSGTKIPAKDSRGQAFRWRMAMDRFDGEYIVV